MVLVLYILLFASRVMTQNYSYAYSLPSGAYTITPGGGFSNPKAIAWHNETDQVIFAGDNHRFLHISMSSGVPVVVGLGASHSFSTAGGPDICTSILHVPLTNYFLFTHSTNLAALSKVDVSNAASPVIINTYSTVAVGQQYKSLRILDPVVSLMVTGDFIHIRDYSATAAPIMAVASMTSTAVAQLIGVKNSRHFVASFSAPSVEVIHFELVSTQIINRGTLTALNGQVINGLIFMKPVEILLACQSIGCSIFGYSASTWSLLNTFVLSNPILTLMNGKLDHALYLDNSNILQVSAFNSGSNTLTSIFFTTTAINAQVAAFSRNDAYIAVGQLNTVQIYSCQPCHFSCATCFGFASNQCLSCWPGETLTGGTCTYTCHSSCAGCSGLTSTDCTGCPSGKQLVSGECITCHSSCATCNGPLQSDCLTCSPPKVLDTYNACVPCDQTCLTCFGPTWHNCLTCDTAAGRFLNSSRDSCDLQPSSVSFAPSLPTPPSVGEQQPTAERDCYLQNKVFDAVNGLCLECFDPAVFKDRKDICTQYRVVRYVDWTADLTVDEDSNRVVFKRFKINLKSLNNDYLLPVGTNLPGGPNFTRRFTVEFSKGLEVKIVEQFNDSIAYEVRNAIDRETIQVVVTTTDNKNNSIVYDDGRLKYILVRKSVSHSLNLTQMALEILGGGSMNIPLTVITVSRLVILGLIPVFFISSAFSLDFSSGFIKVFQLIDIMGNCYHSPVHYSVVMDTSLKFISSLSNLMNFDFGFLIPGHIEPLHRSYNKMTRHKISQHILSQHGITIVSLLIFFLLNCLNTWFKRSKAALLRRLAMPMLRLSEFIFQSSIVDAVFFSSFGLITDFDDWSQLGLGKKCANKLICLAILSTFVYYMTEGIWMNVSLRDKVKKPQQVQELRGVELHGIKIQSISSLGVRMFSQILLVKIMVMMLVVVSSQPSALLCGCTLIAVAFSYQFYFTITSILNQPFQSWLVSMEYILIDLCLLIFLLVNFFASVGHYHKYAEQAALCCMMLTMTVQLTISLNSLLNAILNCIKKRRIRNSVVSRSRFTFAKPPKNPSQAAAGPLETPQVNSKKQKFNAIRKLKTLKASFKNKASAFKKLDKSESNLYQNPQTVSPRKMQVFSPREALEQMGQNLRAKAVIKHRSTMGPAMSLRARMADN